MRTTVNIEERALEMCKQRAAESGQTLGEVISAAIFDACSRRPTGTNPRKYTVPTSGRGGLLPGVDLDDSDALQEIMDGLR